MRQRAWLNGVALLTVLCIPCWLLWKQRQTAGSGFRGCITPITEFATKPSEAQVVPFADGGVLDPAGIEQQKGSLTADVGSATGAITSVQRDALFTGAHRQNATAVINPERGASLLQDHDQGVSEVEGAGRTVALSDRQDASAVKSPARTTSIDEVGGLNASAVVGLQLPHLHPLFEIISTHSVNRTLLFTVVSVPPGSSYWRWVKNWHLSIERSFAPEFAFKRLIVGVGAGTCEELARHDIAGCATDLGTRDWWPGAGRGGEDTAVRIKFSWTFAALTFGYRVLYNDVDVIYTGRVDPLRFLLEDQVRDGMLPDIQQVSDHIMMVGETGCETQLAEQLMRPTAAGSWVNNTLSDLTPYPLPCPIVGVFYLPGATCMSTGFFMALPTGPTIRLFSLVVMALAMEPTAWEQMVFNHVLALELSTQVGRFAAPEFTEVKPSTLRVVSLDPRVIGNWNADRCCRSVSPANVTRIALHMGYEHGEDKVRRAIENQLWFIAH